MRYPLSDKDYIWKDEDSFPLFDLSFKNIYSSLLHFSAKNT